MGARVDLVLSVDVSAASIILRDLGESLLCCFQGLSRAIYAAGWHSLPSEMHHCADGVS